MSAVEYLLWGLVLAAGLMVALGQLITASRHVPPPPPRRRR